MRIQTPQPYSPSSCIKTPNQERPEIPRVERGCRVSTSHPLCFPAVALLSSSVEGLCGKWVQCLLPAKSDSGGASWAA